ncbi:TnsA-like heteromeric transposase endonuclease subunit [Streptomyces sp. NPDC088115]|uniref:TnsA-like heteromeric transposase endonuclease subunit n=1 Tax=Streptomyces sp. NPDC088115 TaxID=3365824 RepID=UPI00380FDABA
MGEPVGAYGDPALSAFDLDFFDTGRRRRTALGSGWDVRCEDVAPVREFRWNTGGRGFAGWYYAVTTGSHVGYESWLERDPLILLNFAPCGGIASQPFWLHWREAEVKRRHAPDYFVRLADGRSMAAWAAAARPVRPARTGGATSQSSTGVHAFRCLCSSPRPHAPPPTKNQHTRVDPSSGVSGAWTALRSASGPARCSVLKVLMDPQDSVYPSVQWSSSVTASSM